MYRIECFQPDGTKITGYTETLEALVAISNASMNKNMSKGWDAQFILVAINITVTLIEAKT